MHSFIHSFVGQHADALMKETIEKEREKNGAPPTIPASNHTRILDASRLISSPQLQASSSNVLLFSVIGAAPSLSFAGWVTKPQFNVQRQEKEEDNNNKRRGGGGMDDQTKKKQANDHSCG